MHIGVLLGLAFDAGRPEFLELLGPALEERGLESRWLAEHVVLFDDTTAPIPTAVTVRRRSRPTPACSNRSWR